MSAKAGFITRSKLLIKQYAFQSTRQLNRTSNLYLKRNVLQAFEIVSWNSTAKKSYPCLRHFKFQNYKSFIVSKLRKLYPLEIVKQKKAHILFFHFSNKRKLGYAFFKSLFNLSLFTYFFDMTHTYILLSQVEKISS